MPASRRRAVLQGEYQGNGGGGGLMPPSARVVASNREDHALAANGGAASLRPGTTKPRSGGGAFSAAKATGTRRRAGNMPLWRVAVFASAALNVATLTLLLHHYASHQQHHHVTSPHEHLDACVPQSGQTGAAAAPARQEGPNGRTAGAPSTGKPAVTADSVINLNHGDPTMFEAFWRETGDAAEIVIPGWQTMSYFSDVTNVCWFLEPEFDQQVCRLHCTVGNAAVDGYHDLVGTGSTRLSPGLERTMEDIPVDKMVNNGIGLVDPNRAPALYEGLHYHLQSSSIDGVKVDIIHLMEMLCEDISMHPCPAFHAASRAISGGPVYVSDFVGRQDFGLRHRLALPDGTILRCEHHALPTRDCLFRDPLLDGDSMLKIWNLNRFSGVLGAFNCQGGGWSPEAWRNKCASEFSGPVTARAGPADIEWKSGKTHPVPVKGATQLFAVYFVEAKKLELLLPEETVELTLEPFHYELLVVAPVRVIAPERAIGFAPIGLANMLNAGGAVQAFDAKRDTNSDVTAEVAVKGAGQMVAYSSARPRLCRVNGEDAEFAYKDGMVTVDVPWSGSSSKLCRVEYVF